MERIPFEGTFLQGVHSGPSCSLLWDPSQGIAASILERALGGGVSTLSDVGRWSEASRLQRASPSVPRVCQL